MRRFDMNECFPQSGPRDIESYIDCSYVLIHEDGYLIPLEKRGFGNAQGLSPEAIKKLVALQGRGVKIYGDVCPGYNHPINLEGDVEIFQPFVRESADNQLLLKHQVNVRFEQAG